MLSHLSLSIPIELSTNYNFSILVDRRNNVLELYNKFEVEKKSFTNKVRAVLNKLPLENATKWKVEALKNHNKVTLTLRNIIKQDSKKVKKSNEKVMLHTNIGYESVGDDFLSSSRVMETISKIPENGSLLLKTNLEELTVDEFITLTKQNEAIFSMGCVSDIKENISQVENLITDKYTPKKEVMCGTVVPIQNSYVLLMKLYIISVASIFYSPSVENILDTSNDTVLLKESPKKSNFVFVTPTKRNFTKEIPRRKLFHDNITESSLFESNYSIDLLRKCW
ncbi:Uncharacterized protein FWK35_00011510 [Aphis craccivora]|uniref:Uncharacterized protein n=1 Tax=Aphis craccivora TaxID=307492 RepID=A0A6G0Y9R3_APHCR|nr:Uncharacterized protein FWK35_00011510 [Aphis craccivora]